MGRGRWRSLAHNNHRILGALLKGIRMDPCMLDLELRLPGQVVLAERSIYHRISSDSVDNARRARQFRGHNSNSTTSTYML